MREKYGSWILSSSLGERSDFKLRQMNYDVMGQTVPSYRIATEIERIKWKIFRQRLCKRQKKLEEMRDYLWLYNSAGSIACRLQFIHPIIMSIVFEHYKQLEILRKSIRK
jgi:hypothetical protein